MSDPDDAQLAVRIASGDEAAFVLAYDRHASYLFGSLVRFLGDREIAAEVVQDAFVTLWRRASQFDVNAGSLLTWLLSIARPRAIDRLRAEGRRPLRNATSLDAFVPGGAAPASATREDMPRELIAGPATDPGTVAQRRWTQAVVRTGIAELSEHEREVIVLAYSLDLSQAQIAARLAWPIGTVKSRTRRAIAQLRGHLAGLGEPDDVEPLVARADMTADQTVAKDR